MARGKFITFEGGEGAGKSTQVRLLAESLRTAGLRVVETREPGGSPGAEEIRELLIHGEASRWDATSEALLHFAARRDHVKRVIEPALAAGDWVLCDRFTDATYAYQGGGRGVDRERIALLEGYVQGLLCPDLTLLFDLPVATGLARIGKRSALDRFELEAQRFFDGVRAEYLAIARCQPDRVHVIDADAPVEQVSEQVRRRVVAFLDEIGR